MRAIISGGGTAGHINPAITVANCIRKHKSKSEILFIGTKTGMENILVPKVGYDIDYIEVSGLKRSFDIKNIAAFFKALNACVKCWEIIKNFKPDVVIGTGGYVSGPVLYTAALMHIPTIIHEQNVFAGMTSKILSKSVDTVCISFEKSREKFSNAKNVVLTGNQIRPELLKTDYQSARNKLGIDNKPFIVSFGGSLGAKRINECMTHFVKNVPEGKYNVLFATGEREYKEVKNNLGNFNKKGIDVVSYIYNMEEVMNAADVLICRAGAITISEINALGKPSILIPSPNVTDNHQYYNAKLLADNGAALMIEEKDLENKSFSKKIEDLLNNKQKLMEMSECSAKMGIKNSDEIIYDEILKICKK